MRWLLMLFVINVAIGFVLWLDYRDRTPELDYVPGRVTELKGYDRGDGCFLYGPMESESLAMELVRALSSSNVESAIIPKEEEKAPRYWVYYGPMNDYSEALSQLSEFKQKNIDAFIITRDDLYGALSLGVFENIDSAQRMQRIMRAKNYTVSIRNIFTFETRWWVEVARPESGLKVSKINEIARSLGVSQENREFFCKTVAKAKSFP